jgi:hypothetical protein
MSSSNSNGICLCLQVAGAITPVPGGMGPVTIAMLMANTARSAQLAMERPAPPWLSTAGRWFVTLGATCVAGLALVSAGHLHAI